MANAQRVKLGEVADLNGGFAFKSEQYKDSGRFVLRTVNIDDGFSITREGATYISEEDAKEYERFTLREHDTLFVMVAATLGKIGYVRSRDLPALLNQNMWVIRAKPNKIDPIYLHYLFREISKIPLSWVGGSARSFLRRDDVRNLEFDLPPKAIQEAVGGLLKRLDDKIEVNRRMNETLEALAQAIFKDWFVSFGPTRRKAEGEADPVAILGGLIPDPTKAAPLAALFPDSLGEGGLPEGWEAKTLGDVVEPRKGRNITKKTVVAGQVPVVAGGLSPAYFHNTPNVIGPVITASASGANAGFVRIYFQDIWASDCSFISGEQTDYLFSIYVILSSRQDEIYSMQQGAAQPHIYPSDLKRLAITDAPTPIWQALEDLLTPIFELIANNEQQNRTLAETRDYLLPKLMSGAVRVRDTESVAQGQITSSDRVNDQEVIAFPTDLLGQTHLTPDQETERDAVMVASTVRAFRDGDTVVGNVKIQKGCYFIRRRAGISVQSFEKQAAGPYDQTLNHEGGRGEATKRKWIRRSVKASADGRSIKGNVPDSRISEIDSLLDRYQLTEATNWVVQHFASKTRDELECLATIDFAMRSLAKKKMSVSLETIKADIASDPVWEPKLAKPHFSDAEISRAVRLLKKLFGGVPND